MIKSLVFVAVAGNTGVNLSIKKSHKISDFFNMLGKNISSSKHLIDEIKLTLKPVRELK